MDNKSGNAKKPELIGEHPGKSFLFFLTSDEAIYDFIICYSDDLGNDLFGEEVIQTEEPLTFIKIFVKSFTKFEVLYFLTEMQVLLVWCMFNDP